MATQSSMQVAAPGRGHLLHGLNAHECTLLLDFAGKFISPMVKKDTVSDLIVLLISRLKRLAAHLQVSVLLSLMQNVLNSK